MNRPPPRSPLFPHTPLSRPLDERSEGAATKSAPPRLHGLSPRRAPAACGRGAHAHPAQRGIAALDRKSTRLNSSHTVISYAVFCLKKKKTTSTLTYHTSQQT